MASWWNWDTRSIQNLVPQGVEGSSPSEATNIRPNDGTGRHVALKMPCASVSVQIRFRPLNYMETV